MQTSFMRSFGHGGPSIDAVLASEQVQPGGFVSGMLHIQGGEQGGTANRAVVELVARVSRTVGHQEHEVDEVIQRLDLPGPIPLGHPVSAPFRLDLPPYTPVTTLGGRNFVWLRSGLDMPWQFDPGDTDRLLVYPTQAQANVLSAMQQLGFGLQKVDIEARASWHGRRWVQEFEFRPSGYHHSRYSEVEIVFENIYGNQVEVLMQLDRASRGLGGFLSEMTGGDESWMRATLDASSPHSAAAALQWIMR